MARKIGHNSIDFAMQVKGQETSMHEPRIKANMAYGFMFAPAGADHCGSATDGAVSTDKGLTAYHTLGWQSGFVSMKSVPVKWASTKWMLATTPQSIRWYYACLSVTAPKGMPSY